MRSEKRGQFEDAPQPQAVAAVPNDQELLRSLQAGPDVQDALHFPLVIFLIYAQTIEENQLTGRPKYQHQQKSEHPCRVGCGFVNGNKTVADTILV